jgi:hypothetical protein
MEETPETPDIPRKCRDCIVAEWVFRICNSLAADSITIEEMGYGPDAVRAVRARHAAALAALCDIRRYCPGTTMDNRCLWKGEGNA